MSDAATRKMNLVIVEDDLSTARLVAKVVERGLGEWLDVHSFNDPLDAHMWIQNNVCDVLLTDIEMPQITGLELLRRAKKRNPWTQVVMMTAFSSWDVVSDSIEAGASDFLVKPLDHSLLIEVLKQEYARFLRWQQALANSTAVAQ
ncbi:MAG: response regulator [Planctomycetales bacterium]|nr:response regulator [Planctomycetales bacterium]